MQCSVLFRSLRANVSCSRRVFQPNTLSFIKKGPWFPMSQEQRLDRVSAPTLWELRQKVAATLSSVQWPGAKEVLCEPHGTCGTATPNDGSQRLNEHKRGSGALRTHCWRAHDHTPHFAFTAYEVFSALWVAYPRSASVRAAALKSPPCCQ